MLLWSFQLFLKYVLRVLGLVIGLEIPRPRIEPNPRPTTWPSLPRPRNSASWSRPRLWTFMLSLKTHQGQGYRLTSLLIYMYNRRFLVLTIKIVSQQLTECQRHSRHMNTTIFTISFLFNFYVND